MFSSQLGLPPALLLFSMIFLHLFCFHFTDGTQNACHDLLTGASRIRAMLHNEHTDQFYLLTSSGHIFIEPISNFDHASSPPSLRLTQAKYSMPTEWNINRHPETITADGAKLNFWVNPDNQTETLLNNVWQFGHTICAYPGVKLDEEKAQVEQVLGICNRRDGKTIPDFWLGFNSQSYGMLDSNRLYCRIYYFPNGKNYALLSSNPWEYNAECMGLALEEGKPQCGVVHKEGDVAVVIVDTSTVYVYRKLLSDSHWYALHGHGKNHLLTKQYRDRPQPTKHQISEFIKCQERKAENNPSDVASNVEQPGVNQPKPSEPKTHKPMRDTPMMRKLLLIIPGFLLLVAFLFGLVVKFNLIQAFPWNRKRKVLISQAYSVAISKASVVSRESTLQRILRQRNASLGKLPKKRGNKKPATPGAVTKMLDKVKKKLFNSVKVAKKPNKKKIKKKKKKKGRW